MFELGERWKKYIYVYKSSTATLYGIIVSIAVNLFLTPGHIYSSGITGLAQLLSTLCERSSIPLDVAFWIFILNFPLFFISWNQLGRKFTIFTFFCVIISSVMLRIIHLPSLTHDPIICAIFGGAINGFGIGITLKNGISTGGLDIISLIIQKYFDRSIGSINIIFNTFIVIDAGFMFGWQYTFYSILGLYVSSKVIDIIYTPQKKIQVLIITSNPNKVMASLNTRVKHGVTIINGAEGAYSHKDKTILLTVVSQFEQKNITRIISESDPSSFISISENIQVQGNFRNPDL